MKRLTNKQKKTILWSLPVVILAAIAFITVPSLLPESYDSMKRSVVTVECGEYYEILSRGRVIACCNNINADTTLHAVSVKPDSDTERKAMVCGCWINRFTFMPSCQGRILTVSPFTTDTRLISMANRNIGTMIEKTIKRAEEMLATDRRRETEMDYYLNTHNVKDEGYNAIAAYAEENKKKKDSLQHSINLLKSLQQKK